MRGHFRFHLSLSFISIIYFDLQGERGIELMPVINMNREPVQADALGEFHIASAVVYARIDRMPDVIKALEAMAGVQVHATSADGKLVVTLEGDRSSRVSDLFGAVQAVPGVMSTALVYQHHEHADSLFEDKSNDTDSSRIH
jgi:periplasmic nitrate reductase NapD